MFPWGWKLIPRISSSSFHARVFMCFPCWKKKILNLVENFRVVNSYKLRLPCIGIMVRVNQAPYDAGTDNLHLKFLNYALFPKLKSSKMQV